MHYERTESSAASERAWERTREQWAEGIESLESDIENLDDYRQRIEKWEYDVLEQIEEAREYVTKLSASLDALERLAR